MPMVEIDEAELLAQRQSIEALQKMLGHSEARTLVLQAQKLVNPDIAIPEIDAAAPVLEEVKALKEQIEADKKETAETKAKEEEESKLATITAQWEGGRKKAEEAGYTEEGLGQLESYMEAHGIADHEIAMPSFEKKHPLPEPAETGGTTFHALGPQTEESTDLKPLFESAGQSEAWLRDMTDKALKESRG